MHPSVINGDESAAQQPQPADQQQHTPNAAQQSASHHAQQPQTRTSAFSSPFSTGSSRFPFDDSDDDMFGDLDMRARLGRMGAFDWGAQKRAGASGGPATGASTSGGSAFPDADAFFSQDPFGHHFAPFDGFRSASRPKPSAAASTAGPQPSHDRSHFYDHLPDEFRQYFPESFGHSFPRMRTTGAHQPPAASPPQQQPVSVPVNAAPAPARPNVCDAAIQTDSHPHESQPAAAEPRAPSADVHATGSGAPATSARVNAGATASGGERHVPIFIEGRSAAPQRASAPPTDDRTDGSGAPSAGDVPQTPHTADCIGKIQNIQSDVLNLMAAVDRFAGRRGDKEYMFIDEMLTRNLLKLDTIDTQGRENIRLARKEAIRCIQASIAVLEAKAEQNAQRQADADAPAAGDAPAAADEAELTNEASLERTLAEVERRSAEREQKPAEVLETGDEVQLTEADDGEAPAAQAEVVGDASVPDEPTHVSAVQIQLKPIAKSD